MPSRIVDIRRWKYSGADEIPKGNRFKQNLLNGVMNVVSKADSTDRGTCQSSGFASSLVTNFSHPNCPSVYSTNSISCCSRSMVLLSFVIRTMQILTSSCCLFDSRYHSLFFHHLFSSFFVLAMSGRGSLLGTVMVKGWASSFIVIV